MSSGEITATVIKLEQECMRCGVAFSWFGFGSRRHHCRCCWRAFCSDHCSKKAIVLSPSLCVFSLSSAAARSPSMIPALPPAYVTPVMPASTSLWNLLDQLLPPLTSHRRHLQVHPSQRVCSPLAVVTVMQEERLAASIQWLISRSLSTWAKARSGKC